MVQDHFWTVFAGHVQRQPRRVALVYDPGPGSGLVSLNWSELNNMTGRVAAWLDQNFGIASGQRIVHTSTNSLSDLLIWMACLRTGRVDVPIDGHLSQAMAHDLIRRAAGQWVESSDVPIRHDGVDAPPAALYPSRPSSADDDAVVLWTSGTTARPQGVRLSNRALLINAQDKLEAVPHSIDDVRLTVLPFCHAYARTCDVGTWLISGCTLAISRGGEGLQRVAAAVHPTHVNLVPVLAKRWLNQAPDSNGQSRLRVLGCGGAGLDEATFHRWTERGVTVIHGYGLTETGPVIASATVSDARPGLVGPVTRHWQHRVIDGRLFVRGPAVMSGYIDDAPATALRIDPDGWLDTGDAVAVDPTSGQLKILGRCDDAIVLDCGHKIQPTDVERRLESIPPIRHAMVGQEDGVLVAWIVTDQPNDSLTLESLLEPLGDLPNYARPKQFFRVWPPPTQADGSLTMKGTIRRRELAQSLSQRSVTPIVG
ncbi:class I adenylate-forming enzyme family protein [Crateriforma spongiae]|uniref:class I adenylate-forming enzyme family protein n=1 Tax=Crateriforma spongiae TaxID=2724528 RepID=UPI001447B73D|nr:class I adenylate-forming enzyme family protein [Crateriforma spongiae]